MLEEVLNKVKLAAISGKRVIIEDTSSYLVVFGNDVLKFEVNSGRFLLGYDFPLTEVLDLADTLVRQPFC